MGSPLETPVASPPAGGASGGSFDEGHAGTQGRRSPQARLEGDFCGPRVSGARKTGGRFPVPVPIEISRGGPKNGPGFRPPQISLQSVFFLARPQAKATLQWNNFLESRCEPPRTVLRINMDETSVKLWQGGLRGCIAQGGGQAAGAPLEQAVSLRSRRAALSLVCFVCDDPVAQRLLPQVIVGNEKVLAASVAQEFQDAHHGNIYLLRRKSAWVNGGTLRCIIQLLAAAVEPLQASRHIILSMDACPVHLVPSVLRSVAKGGMHFLLIAAKMTKWMQPCDVAVFAPLKHRLRQLYGAAQIEARAAELPPKAVLHLIATAVDEVVTGKNWAPAFRRCGLQGGWPTSTRFLQALGSMAGRQESSDLPSLAQLQTLFPRGRDIPLDALFATCLRPLGRAEALPGRPGRPSSAAAPDPAGASRSPWLGRTRSTSALALEVDEPVASAGPSAAPSAPSAPQRPRDTVPWARPLLVPWPLSTPR